MFTIFLIKLDGLTIKNLIELLKGRINLIYTKSNRLNGADLMFLFKEDVDLIIERLSFNSNTNFVFSVLSTLKLSKNGQWLKISDCKQR